MIPPPPSWDDPYEPDWEHIALERQEGERLKDWQNYTLEAERQLHDPRYCRSQTDRHLHDSSKEVKSLKRALWEEYHFDFDNDCFEVLLEDGETSITLSRDGVHRDRVPHTLTARQEKKFLRRRKRRLKQFMTERGEKSAGVTGDEDRSFITVAAAA
jgi:hypothetical protein